MALNKKQQQLYSNRKKCTVDIYNSLNGDISCKELAKLVGVTDSTVMLYLKQHFEELRSIKLAR